LAFIPELFLISCLPEGDAAHVSDLEPRITAREIDDRQLNVPLTDQVQADWFTDAGVRHGDHRLGRGGDGGLRVGS
jgi:hypothetical protein